MYDATDNFGPKSDMPKYEGDLKPGDIVLIEVTVGRWAPRDLDGDSKAGKGKASFKKRNE